MFEQKLPQGLSLLALNAVFSRGDTAYVFSTEYPAVIDSQADVAEFLETATTTASNDLKVAMSKIHPPKTGRLRHVREFFGDLFARSALSMTLYAQIGEIGLSFEFNLGLSFPMSFMSVQEVFGALIPSLGRDLLRQFTAIADANDFYFRPEAQGYVRKKKEAPKRDPVSELLDLLRTSGLGIPMRSRSGAGYSVIVTNPEQLAQIFGGERGSSPFRGRERRSARQEQQEVPPGHFVCKGNGNLMSIAKIVGRLQEIRKELGGKLDRQRVYDFYAPEVLTALDLADVESGYYPLKDGSIEPIPSGYYWEGIVGEMSKIPEGQYVSNGNLKVLPTDTEYDAILRRPVATTPFHYFDLASEQVLPIPFGTHVGANGLLTELEAGWHLLADGSIERVADGNYPTPDGELEEIPDGHYFNYKTQTLELIPEGFEFDWPTSRLKPKETATAE